MKLKIMEYNIKDGFTKEIAKDKFIYEKYREKSAVRIVKDFDPDILLICEANFIVQHKKINPKNPFSTDYKKIFSFPFCSYLIKHGHDGSVILSKFPIITMDFSIDNRVFGRTILKMGKKVIIIDNIHPHPIKVNNFNKYRWVKSVLRDKKNPYILIGDFNSLSRLDKYSREYLINFFEPIIKFNLWGEVDSMMKYEVVDEILKNGLQDTYKLINRRFDYTCPTSTFKSMGQNEKGIRIDYIFCSKDFKVLDSGIIKNELSEKASDHYPIYAILELK